MNEVGAAVASGSFKNAGMIVAPCSMKTLSAIAAWILRQSDHACGGCRFEGKAQAGLDGEGNATESGSHPEYGSGDGNGRNHLPALPGFYCHPLSIDEMVDQTLRRVLDLFDMADDQTSRWSGMV